MTLQVYDSSKLEEKRQRIDKELAVLIAVEKEKLKVPLASGEYYNLGYTQGLYKGAEMILSDIKNISREISEKMLEEAVYVIDKYATNQPLAKAKAIMQLFKEGK